MTEINYDAKTVMRGNYPEIKRFGACSPFGEMSPFVWRGRLYRLELIDPSRGLDKEKETVAGIRDVETGEIVSTFGAGTYYHSAYVEDDTVYVPCVSLGSPDTIMVFESRDLVTWEERILFKNPGWVYCNSAITKGPDGYVILLEAEKPEKYVGPNYYTFFFAKSYDLKEWTHLDPEVYRYSYERYNGGPWLHYSEGWYYLISVTELPCKRFTSYIFRSKDLKDWYVGYYNPIMMPSREDRKISPRAADLTPEFVEEIKHGGFNINNSDLDMCEWKGKTYINYATGNQLGWYYMAEAEYDGPLDKFLKSFFE